MTTQLDCSLGFALESGYGIPATVERFHEFIDESLAWQPEFVQGEGMRVGTRFARAGRRSLVKEMAGGDVNIEVPTKGAGMFFQALFGSATSTAVPDATGAFQQLYTLTTEDPLPSYTIQKGIPLLGGGPVTPLTFHGAVCASGELTANVGEIVKLKTTWNAREVTKETEYAPPAYADGAELFTFVHGAIAVGGTVVAPTTTALATGGTEAGNITEFGLTIDNKIDEGGFTFGSGGKRGRKPVVGLAEVKGKLTAEYDSTVLRDAYLSQEGLSLLLTFKTSREIAPGVTPTLQIVIDQIRLEGELPKSNAGAPVTQSIDFTVLDGLTPGIDPLYAVMVTDDTGI